MPEKERGQEESRENTNGVCSRHKDIIASLDKCYDVVDGWAKSYAQRMDMMLASVREVTQEQIEKCVLELKGQMSHLTLTVETVALQSAKNATAIKGIMWTIGILVVVAIGMAALVA